ncbi:MAG: undecaprenyl/decaprenyl-phosphate alpha-N-acetylglucosaminyl 1-phosphate transferase [Sedimentisphaerales bacterium]|nr:undecaprenyl/decaprenyl-phosphate alpha-N-acetylglucosaminyl 1-phosphate transferase [Sedimentisphaerales bacterium]
MQVSIFGDENPLSQIVRDYWPILPIAFAVALVATPLCRRAAWRLGVLDYPDEQAKTHRAPTAYLGGLAILLGLLAGLVAGMFLLGSAPIESTQGAHTSLFAGQHNYYWILAGVGLGAVIACGVGVLDDLYDIRPRQKFLGQIAAAVVLIAVGVRPDLSHLLHYVNVKLPESWDFLLGVPIVLFFILGATNSLNLLDGLDGLCAGVTAIITTAFALLALILATWGYSVVGDPVRLILCLALVGATLGFLPMNFHPARIFMGDAGSMLLGFVAGTLMLLFAETFGRWTVASIVIFGLPILDTAVALVRRFVNGKPLFVSDRGHIYDQLMDRGQGLQKTVIICYALAALYCLIGLLAALLRFRYAVIVFLVVAILSGLAIWRGNFLQIGQNAGGGDKVEPADTV